MRPITEIKNIKKVVIELLTEHPRLRDNDNKLIANIWYRQINKESTAIELLQNLANGNLISTESICRCRRKVQQDNPELRGENYNLKKKEQIHTRKEIRTV